MNKYDHPNLEGRSTKEAPKPAVIIESVDSKSVDLNDYEELKREIEKKKARKNNRTTVMITDKALVGLEIGAAKEGTTRNDLVNIIWKNMLTRYCHNEISWEGIQT